MSDAISTKQASDLLKCSKQWVVELIKAGELSAQKIGNYYAIDRASVEAYQTRKQQKDK